MGLVLFDTLATYLLWTNQLMYEENPIMLWALQQNWAFWLFKAIQVGLVLILGYYYESKRIARFGVWLLVAVFTFVWVQFFIGSLI
jgi:hypothetical protein